MSTKPTPKFPALKPDPRAWSLSRGIERGTGQRSICRDPKLTASEQMRREQLDALARNAGAR